MELFEEIKQAKKDTIYKVKDILTELALSGEMPAETYHLINRRISMLLEE